MAKSPSVTILERDMSTFTVTSSETVLAVVGYATKGPIGKATLVTSRSEFNDLFGEPVKDCPYSALAVYRAFNQGNQIIFYRVAETRSTNLDRAISAEKVVSIEVDGNPGTSGFATLNVPSTNLIEGLVIGEYYNLEITYNGSNVVDVEIEATAESITPTELISLINSASGVLGSAEIDTDTNVITITSSSIGNSSSVLLDGNLIEDDDVTLGFGTSQNGTNPTTESSDVIKFVAKEKGTSTNLISVEKTTRENPLDENNPIHSINVLYKGIVKETFDNVSLVIEDSNYFVNVINADPDNGGSEWISIEVDDVDNNGIISLPNNEDGEFYELGRGEVPFVDTSTPYDHKPGKDGIPSNREDEIALFVDALNEDRDLGNSDEFDYHILITPDLPVAEVQNAALDLANFRKDFIYIVDPPMSLNYREIANWHNGKNPSRQSPLNTSYGALYWPWLKDFNPVSKEYIWCPPSVFIAEKYMEIDRNFGPWYAPAGDTRGRITASDYETSPSFPQREYIYGDLNAVNPFVNFSSKGLLVYGQKTLLRENSALNRVNVRRMVIYIKKLIKRAMDSMLFEPHNPDSWRRAAGKIISILEPIRQSNGIDQYRVIIDNTTNTPDVIAQSLMRGIIKIVPVGTIEVIELSLQVHKAGSSLDE